MAAIAQARHREGRRAQFVRRPIKQVDVRDIDAVDEYPCDAAIGAAIADPCDRSAGKGERGLRPRYPGERGAAPAPWPVGIAAPSGAQAHRWIGFLVAPYRLRWRRRIRNGDLDRAGG